MRKRGGVSAGRTTNIVPGHAGYVVRRRSESNHDYNDLIDIQ